MMKSERFGILLSTADEETGWYDGQVSSLQQKFIPKTDIVAHKNGFSFGCWLKLKAMMEEVTNKFEYRCLNCGFDESMVNSGLGEIS
jgi:hypothetical protein